MIFGTTTEFTYMNPAWTSLDPVVLFIIGLGITIGIVQGLDNIKNTRLGKIHPAPKARDNNYFFFINYN